MGINVAAAAQGYLLSLGRSFRRRLSQELNQLAYNYQALRCHGAPEVFQIELTNHCPMTCIMCPRTQGMTRTLGHMDDALFRNIVDQIAGRTEGVFLHHFGESLMHPKLGDCVRYARTRGVKTFLSANPALLTDRRAGQLVDSGLHELVLSLDGLTADTNAAIRGPAARNVALAERNILSLLRLRRESGTARPRLILQIVRQKHNDHEIDAWLAKWSAVEGIDRIKVKSYIGWNGNSDYINSLRVESAQDAGEIVCDKPWTSVTILWDGRVVPCCFDHDGLYVLGDLRTQSLDAIWNGDRMRQLRESHRKRELDGIDLCRRCNDREGYRFSRWIYPFNRLRGRHDPLGREDGPALRRQ